MQTAELSYATDEVRGRDGPRHGEEYAPCSPRLELANSRLVTHGGRERFPARQLAALA
jgi:hypothetical protein